MDYQAIYTRIMERARHRDLGDEYFERHHIVPRCMRGTDSPENIAKLTPEEHYLAHQLLVKIHPGHIGVAMALKAMLMNHGRRSNKTYEAALAALHGNRRVYSEGTFPNDFAARLEASLPSDAEIAADRWDHDT